jgi:uncharacterized protein YcbK (DUF882 family)
MKKNFLTISIVLLAAAGITLTSFKLKEHGHYISLVNELFEKAKKMESGVIQKVPIFDDYRSAAIEGELRKHLFKDHIEVASKTGSTQIKSKEEIAELVKKGELVNIDAETDDLYFFYNVPKEFRFLRKFSYDGIKLINDTFMSNMAMYIPEIDPNLKVKIAISSALRPAEYQNNLRNKNQNAVFESTHSYGISFDIFYDEYYVSLVSPPGAKKQDENLEKMKRQLGLTLGAALRRQFHSVLSKTLIDLQQQGKLYAIWESNQRCYHVTILPD